MSFIFYICCCYLLWTLWLMIVSYTVDMCNFRNGKKKKYWWCCAWWKHVWRKQSNEGHSIAISYHNVQCKWSTNKRCIYCCRMIFFFHLLPDLNFFSSLFVCAFLLLLLSVLLLSPIERAIIWFAKIKSELKMTFMWEKMVMMSTVIY